MPLLFVRQDITKMYVDAIVNAANETLLGGGGVDGAIHHAAGSDLLRECRTLGGCKTGEAKRTNAYRLPCKYVIHTVGPVWHGGNAGEEALLSDCYANALRIADESECESVAFPLISSGVYGYPKADAIRVAVRSIRDFLQTHDMTVYLVLFDRDAVDTARARFPGLQQYIDDNAVREIEKRYSREGRCLLNNAPAARRPDMDSLSQRGYDLPDVASEFRAPKEPDDSKSVRKKRRTEKKHPLRDRITKRIRPDVGEDLLDSDEYGSFSYDAGSEPESAVCAPTISRLPEPRVADANASLDDWLFRQIDESFSEMLLRKIDEKGMTDAECYKKANIDRKLFSKIHNNPQYKPSKSTAVAFAIALELPLPEAREMLNKAGYAFSRSSKFDLIVEYFISRGDYDVFEINEALFAYDQNLLGA